MLIRDLSSLVTGRRTSPFALDIQDQFINLRKQIKGKRILVIGGAGSIGSATVQAIVPFRPRSLHVIDQNENSLAELSRDLRNQDIGRVLQDFRTLPLNFGSAIMQRFLQEEDPYDHVLNFSALKHVRSEKDAYSVLQMLDTNVLKPARLLTWLLNRGKLESYFCVSTDKAANPTNLMGSSKRLMEHVIFSGEVVKAADTRITSARFANVAFSDGSLLQSWLLRLDKGQPWAVPKDTRRFFISLEEAGQICLLAAFVAPDRHLLIPKFDVDNDLHDLAELAGNILRHLNYQPEFFEREEDAIQAMSKVKAKNCYPVLLTPLDTIGEKPYEEFIGTGEQSVSVGMSHLLGVPYHPIKAGLLKPFLDRLEALISQADTVIDKAALVNEISALIPEFKHSFSTKSLDERM